MSTRNQNQASSSKCDGLYGPAGGSGAGVPEFSASPAETRPGPLPPPFASRGALTPPLLWPSLPVCGYICARMHISRHQCAGCRSRQTQAARGPAVAPQTLPALTGRACRVRMRAPASLPADRLYLARDSLDASNSGCTTCRAELPCAFAANLSASPAATVGRIRGWSQEKWLVNSGMEPEAMVAAAAAASKQAAAAAAAAVAAVAISDERNH